jgi:very-short-patch-repair endonuclease
MKKYPHYIIDFAKQLRQESTFAESLLWEHLKNRRFHGLKFKRQPRIGKYIADFYCHELCLVVEVEGGIHENADQMEYDQIRFQEFDARDLNVLRIHNDDVVHNIESVLQKILSFR